MLYEYETEDASLISYSHSFLPLVTSCSSSPLLSLYQDWTKQIRSYVYCIFLFCNNPRNAHFGEFCDILCISNSEQSTVKPFTLGSISYDSLLQFSRNDEVSA